MFSFIRKLFIRSKKDGTATQEAPAQDTQAAGGDESADTASHHPESPLESKAWLAIGLDGALAADNGNSGAIGDPVHNTVQRLRDWVEHRELKVKILTPRACTPEGAQAVRDWLKANNLPALEVTAEKDLNMVEFWSARCVQVISNTGQFVGESPTGLDKLAEKTPAGKGGASSEATPLPEASDSTTPSANASSKTKPPSGTSSETPGT